MTASNSAALPSKPSRPPFCFSNQEGRTAVWEGFPAERKSDPGCGRGGGSVEKRRGRRRFLYRRVPKRLLKLTRLVNFNWGRRCPWGTEECRVWEARSGDVAAASFSLLEFSGSEDFCARTQTHTPLSALSPSLPLPSTIQSSELGTVRRSKAFLCVCLSWKGSSTFGFYCSASLLARRNSGREREKETEPVTELGLATLYAWKRQDLPDEVSCAKERI